MESLKIKKVILKAGLLAILAVFIVPNFFVAGVYAQTEPKPYEYTVLAPLPGTTNNKCDVSDPNNAGCKTTLQKYLPGLFNLAIGLSAAFAVLMIVIGGFQYMTTDALQGKQDGRKRIWNAVKGLFLVICAWIVLYTINPNLLTLNLNIEPVNIKPAEGSLSPALPTGAVTDKVLAVCPKCSTAGGLTFNISPENLARFNCQTCSTLGSGIPFGNNTSTNVTPSLNNELSALNNGLKQQGIGWRVTEAFPPTVNHVDGCHYNGGCVDAALTDPTPENIKRFTETARNNGLNPSYEVKTQDEKEKLIKALTDLKMQNPLVVVNPKTNGAHFHVK